MEDLTEFEKDWTEVIFTGKSLYETVKSKHPSTSPEEDMILKKIAQLNGADEKLEDMYYTILACWLDYDKEYKPNNIFKERLRLVELVKLLYDYEEKGLLIKDKYNFSEKHEIKKKQIIDIRKVMMKQLSETYEWFFLKSDMKEGWSPAASYNNSIDYRDFWDTKNVLNWDFENDIIIVVDSTDHALGHLDREAEHFPIPLTKQGIEQILEIEKDRPLFETEKNYIARLLWWIIIEVGNHGYIDKKLKTISTENACILYDTFDLLGLIQGDKSKSDQKKYQDIRRELKKVKTYFPDSEDIPDSEE